MTVGTDRYINGNSSWWLKPLTTAASVLFVVLAGTVAAFVSWIPLIRKISAVKRWEERKHAELLRFVQRPE